MVPQPLVTTKATDVCQCCRDGIMQDSAQLLRVHVMVVDVKVISHTHLLTRLTVVLFLFWSLRFVSQEAEGTMPELQTCSSPK